MTTEPEDREQRNLDQEFKQEGKNIFHEMEEYLNIIHEFQNSPAGHELSTQSRHLSRLIDYVAYNPEQALLKTIQEYQNQGIPYDEQELRAQVQEIGNYYKMSVKEIMETMFPDEDQGDITQAKVQTLITSHLQNLGITVAADANNKIQLLLKSCPVDLSFGGQGITTVNINEGSLDYLDRFQHLILQKLFSQIPSNSVLIYPAIGNDVDFYNTARAVNHQVIGIDDNPNLHIPKKDLFEKYIEGGDDFHGICEELRGLGKIPAGSNEILVFKGFDTLSEISQATIDQIIDKFSGQTIVIIGCRGSSAFGLGVPSIRDKAYHHLQKSNSYQETTGQYFDYEEQKLMDDVSGLGSKFEWTTGFFPGTEIKVYSRKPSQGNV